MPAWSTPALVFLATLACHVARSAADDGAPPPAAAAARDPAKLVNAAERELRVGDVDVALRLLGEALALAPSAKTFYARHKAHVKKNRLPAAIEDLTAALAADPGYSMALLQRGNLLLVGGRCEEAAADYAAALALDPGKRDATARLPHARACAAAIARGRAAAVAGDHEAARAAYSEALAPERATQAPALLLARARASAALGDLDAALADAAKVLKIEPNNPPAYALRGAALHARGDYSTARAHFAECTRFDPEHAECKDGFRLSKAVLKAREAGEAAAGRGDWRAAADAWRAGGAVDPANGVWQREARPALARALLKAADVAGAVEAGEACVALDDGLAPCHALLGEALLAAERFEEAARHGRRAVELDRGNGEFGAFAQRADAALRRSKSKDYYRILNLRKGADDGEIKKAYRAAAKEAHPDKFQDPEEKAAAELRFRDISEAMEVLSDGELRARYDRGEDVTANPGQNQQHGHGFPGGGFPFPGGGGGFQFHFQRG